MPSAPLLILLSARFAHSAEHTDFRKGYMQVILQLLAFWALQEDLQMYQVMKCQPAACSGMDLAACSRVMSCCFGSVCYKEDDCEGFLDTFALHKLGTVHAGHPVP